MKNLEFYYQWLTYDYGGLSFAVAILFAFVGLAIFLLNLLIAVIFLKCKRNLPSDRLIITGSLGDSAYGFMIFTFPFSYAVTEIIKIEMEDYFYHYSNYALDVYMIFDSALVLFSLLIIFFMTLNRYFAIVRPFKYKIYFSESNVRKMSTFVVSVCIFVTLCGIILVFLDVLGSYYAYYLQYGSRPAICYYAMTFVFNFPFFWPQIQLLFVFIDSLLMLFVYTSIARSYTLTCNDICGAVKRNKRQSETGEIKEARSTAMRLHDKETMMDETQNESRDKVEQIETQLDTVGAQSMESAQPVSLNDSSETLSEAEKVALQRLESNRRLTLIFFLVGLVFMSIAFPICIVSTIYGLPQLYDGILEDIHIDDSLAVTLLLRFPYSFIAFIDPILYASSNKLVKQELKRYFNKLCRCCKRSTQTGV